MIPHCDQQVDNAVPGFTGEAVTSGRKTEPGSSVVKAFPGLSVTKSLLCVFPGLFQSGFPGYVNKPRWLPVVAVRGSSVTPVPEEFQPTGAATESTGNDDGNRAGHPGCYCRQWEFLLTGRAFFCVVPILQQETRDRHGWEQTEKREGSAPSFSKTDAWQYRQHTHVHQPAGSR